MVNYVIAVHLQGINKGFAGAYPCNTPNMYGLGVDLMLSCLQEKKTPNSGLQNVSVHKKFRRVGHCN